MPAPEMMNSEAEKEKGHGRNPYLVVGGFLLLGLALAWLLLGNRGAAPADLEQVPSAAEVEAGLPKLPTGAGLLAVGDPAYEFTLPDLEGNPVSLSDFHGRPVIINFWATWCAPCRLEMPELQETFTEYQADGLVILALNQEETPAQVREFFYEELGLTFTPLLDSEGAVGDLYLASQTLPASFFINAEGQITAIHRGLMAKSQIEGYLAETIGP